MCAETEDEFNSHVSTEHPDAAANASSADAAKAGVLFDIPFDNWSPDDKMQSGASNTKPKRPAPFLEHISPGCAPFVFYGKKKTTRVPAQVTDQFGSIQMWRQDVF